LLICPTGNRVFSRSRWRRAFALISHAVTGD
jgi:hypothetical protein